MKMFTALWHNTFVSSNDKEHKVYAARTCEHISDETFMTWDIYNSDGKTVRIFEVCKTEVNGHSALFFFLQPVGVYARECLDEGTLTVIDMSCRPKYYVTHENF